MVNWALLTESVLPLFLISSNFEPQNVLPRAGRTPCSALALYFTEFLVMLVDKSIDQISIVSSKKTLDKHTLRSEV